MLAYSLLSYILSYAIKVGVYYPLLENKDIRTITTKKKAIIITLDDLAVIYFNEWKVNKYRVKWSTHFYYSKVDGL